MRDLIASILRAAARWVDEPPVVQTHVYLDGKEIARAVTKQQLREAARR